MGLLLGFDSQKEAITNLSGNSLVIVANAEERACILRRLSSEFPSLGLREITSSVQFEQALAQGGFDLVISDYSLPWSNGIAIMSELKERYPDCLVAMLVPDPQHEATALEAMKAGLDDYVVQTTDRDHLLRLHAIVRSILERVEIRRQALQMANRIEQLCETLRLAAYTTTIDGQLLDANQVFLALLGIERLEPDLPLLWRDLFVRHEDYDDLRQRLLTSRQTQTRTVLLQRSGGASTVLVRLWELLISHTDEATIVTGYLQAESGQQSAEMPNVELDLAPDRLLLLTPRENQVMEMVVSGMTNKLIAGKLQISMKTVEMHRSRLMKKLRVNSLAELVHTALRARSLRNDRK